MSKYMAGLTLVVTASSLAPAQVPNQAKERRVPQRIALVYEVADLVLAPEQKSEPAQPAGPNQAVAPEAGVDMQPLIAIPTSKVAPDTWKEDGQDDRIGEITPCYTNNSLIIRTTAKVHDQVVQRLRQLRRLPAVQSPG